MPDFSALLVPDRGQKARPIHLVDKSSFAAWLKTRPAEDRALLEAMRFDGKKPHEYALLPRGNDFEVVGAVKSADKLSPWCLARLAEGLPEGTYKLSSGDPGLRNPGNAALGWLLGQHRFDAYRKTEDSERGPRILLTGEAAQVEAQVRRGRERRSLPLDGAAEAAA